MSDISSYNKVSKADTARSELKENWFSSKPPFLRKAGGIPGWARAGFVLVAWSLGVNVVVAAWWALVRGDLMGCLGLGLAGLTCFLFGYGVAVFEG